MNKIKHAVTLAIMTLTIIALTEKNSLAQSNIIAIENEAKALANRMQSVLPMKSGGTQTLIAVRAAGSLLIYDHTLDVKFPPENTPLIIDWLRGQSYKSACSVRDLERFLQLGGSLHYRFFYENNLLTSVKVERCNFK